MTKIIHHAALWVVKKPITPPQPVLHSTVIVFAIPHKYGLSSNFISKLSSHHSHFHTA